MVCGTNISDKWLQLNLDHHFGVDQERCAVNGQKKAGDDCPGTTKQVFSVRCTRGSNGSVERTGGEARCQVY
jgi:hypothetical protein